MGDPRRTFELLRRGFAFLAVVGAVGAGAVDEAGAHPGLRQSQPVAGTKVGAAPKTVRLTLSEDAAASLSTIRVLDRAGAAYQVGRPKRVGSDARSLDVPVRKLARGVYTVDWRIVSAVDGHATTGAYVFGVQVAPTGSDVSAGSSEPSVSRLEVLARWLFLVGLVGLVGAASASVARFGGAADVGLGAAGWGLAAVGLALLAEAQARAADVSLGSLMESTVGSDLIWRGVALGTAGVALLLAGLALGALRRLGMAAVWVAAVAAIAVHVSAGHAAAGGWSSAATIAAQSSHFAAAGVWLGGLVALLLGVRGAPSAAKAEGVRRFSRFAAAGLLVVVATGALRAVDELASLHELFSTSYGRAVVAKVALILVIVAIAAFNRRHSVPASASDLRPLRRRSKGELVLAAGALAAAAVLGTVSPPAAGRPPAPAIDVSGANADAALRARLTATSDKPGPNLFNVRVTDVDGEPVRADDVSLRFAPVDDPWVEATSLTLVGGPDESHVGSGANLGFEGRWKVTVQVERNGEDVEIPLEVETRRGEEQRMTVLRPPGRDPEYTLETGDTGFVVLSPHPEQAGRSTIEVTFVDLVREEIPVDELVLTLASEDRPTRQQAVRRLGRGRFAAVVELADGTNTITVVARRADGVRLRSVADLNVPDD